MGGVAMVALALGIAPASAVEVRRFNGSATDIGVQREPGGVGGVEYRIRGDFDYEGTLDLSRAEVIWESLLEEVGPGAAGELITTTDDAAVVPLLVPRRTVRPNEVIFETQDYRPQVRFQFRRNKASRYEFRLKLDRGLSRTVPALCTGDPPKQKSNFRHRFLIDDGVNPPLEVSTIQEWDCSNLEGFQLKARQPERPSPGSPTPQPTVRPTPRPTSAPVVGIAPRASLRAEALTRTSGAPDRVALDASDSSDQDGTIVRYRFDSGDGRIQDGPSPTAEFVYAPGDYRAEVTVFDDDGNAATASRSFSEK
jgi:hypothetical protein